jgi:hypothetical protein
VSLAATKTKTTTTTTTSTIFDVAMECTKRQLGKNISSFKISQRSVLPKKMRLSRSSGLRIHVRVFQQKAENQHASTV